jgi:hypothetical protein
MAKKSSHTRKPSGAAAIQSIDDDLDHETAEEHHESNGDESVTSAVKPKRTAKAKTDQPTEGHVGIADIKKAAAFANSIGGLDKAIALLQILKVAKEVQ